MNLFDARRSLHTTVFFHSPGPYRAVTISDMASVGTRIDASTIIMKPKNNIDNRIITHETANEIEIVIAIENVIIIVVEAVAEAAAAVAVAVAVAVIIILHTMVVVLTTSHNRHHHLRHRQAVIPHRVIVNAPTSAHEQGQEIKEVDDDDDE